MTKRILTVDDSASMRMLLKASLTKQGFAIETADDGEHGLSRMCERNPDLLITDIHIWKEGRPTGDGGLLLTGRLRNFPALQSGGRLVGLPIIAISGAVGDSSMHGVAEHEPKSAT